MVCVSARELRGLLSYCYAVGKLFRVIISVLLFVGRGNQFNFGFTLQDFSPDFKSTTLLWKLLTNALKSEAN